MTSPSSASSSRALRTATPRARGRRDARGVLDEERDLERPPTRRRQGRQNLVETPSNRSPRPAYARARSDSAGRDERHAQPRPRALDDRAPERRLPDSGVAFQRERDRTSPAAAVEKRMKRAELLVSADDFDGHFVAHRDRAQRESQPPLPGLEPQMVMTIFPARVLRPGTGARRPTSLSSYRLSTTGVTFPASSSSRSTSMSCSGQLRDEEARPSGCRATPELAP